MECMDAGDPGPIVTMLGDNNEDELEVIDVLEFNDDDKTGFIDFIYFDAAKDGWVIVDFKTGSESEGKNSKYQEQLDFYQSCHHLYASLLDESLGQSP